MPTPTPPRSRILLVCLLVVSIQDIPLFTTHPSTLGRHRGASEERGFNSRFGPMVYITVFAITSKLYPPLVVLLDSKKGYGTYRLATCCESGCFASTWGLSIYDIDT